MTEEIKTDSGTEDSFIPAPVEPNSNPEEEPINSQNNIKKTNQ